MNFFDSENNIINMFQEYVQFEIGFMPLYQKQLIEIFEKVYLFQNWMKWTDSSAKDAPPPDFFCDEFQLMMDVMRVNDHEYKNRKGKPVNPVYIRERKIANDAEKQIKKQCVLNPSPTFLINAISDLPTEQDHNYNLYRSHFVKTVNSHIKKIRNYKRTHPDYKLIFFIMDESSAYCKVKRKPKVYKAGNRIKIDPHQYYYDESFVKVFANTDIDYVIWFAPFKRIDSIHGVVPQPKVFVYDTKKIDYGKLITYDEKFIISAELGGGDLCPIPKPIMKTQS